MISATARLFGAAPFAYRRDRKARMPSSMFEAAASGV
jgi:hypothetical protein